MSQDFLDKLSEKERLRKQEEIELENEHLTRNQMQEEELNLEPQGSEGGNNGEPVENHNSESTRQRKRES